MRNRPTGRTGAGEAGMICKECRHARRFADDGVYCVEYGMIIRANHDCRLKGAERHDGDEDQRQAVGEETELQDDGGGAFGEMPGLL